MRVHRKVLVWPKNDKLDTILINPDEDGVTHINVYSKAKTELGRFLTNFAYSPFVCADGAFDSIEGYWYWLGTSHPDRDKLHKLSGWEAKSFGRKIKAADWPAEDDVEFKAKIKDAINRKLLAYPKALEALVATDLPLKHYYVYGGTHAVEPPENSWVLEHLEWIRTSLKEMNSTR
jgi:hypothetical protein